MGNFGNSDYSATFGLRQEEPKEQKADLLATCDRSWGDKHEELRIEISSYQGKRFVNMRVWWQTADGEWRPGKSGLAIKNKELDAVTSALILAKAKLQ